MRFFKCKLICSPHLVFSQEIMVRQILSLLVRMGQLLSFWVRTPAPFQWKLIHWILIVIENFGLNWLTLRKFWSSCRTSGLDVMSFHFSKQYLIEPALNFFTFSSRKCFNRSKWNTSNTSNISSKYNVWFGNSCIFGLDDSEKSCLFFMTFFDSLHKVFPYSGVFFWDLEENLKFYDCSEYFLLLESLFIFQQGL